MKEQTGQLRALLAQLSEQLEKLRPENKPTPLHFLFRDF